jgi:hypothetical protein
MLGGNTVYNYVGMSASDDTCLFVISILMMVLQDEMQDWVSTEMPFRLLARTAILLAIGTISIDPWLVRRWRDKVAIAVKRMYPIASAQHLLILVQ